VRLKICIGWHFHRLSGLAVFLLSSPVPLEKGLVVLPRGFFSFCLYHACMPASEGVLLTTGVSGLIGILALGFSWILQRGRDYYLTVLYIEKEDAHMWQKTRLCIIVQYSMDCGGCIEETRWIPL
jgi:hypothetical protein